MKLLSVNTLFYCSSKFARFLNYQLAITFTICSLLVSCGGGGGGGGGNKASIFNASIPSVSSTTASSTSSSASAVWQAGVFTSQDKFANKCISPRTGIDPATSEPFADIQGTFLDENNFVRSWNNDTYLWYAEVQDRNPNTTKDPLSYFALLKTNAITASGNNKDNFHFTYDSSVWYNLSESGVSAGYGIQFSWIANTPPRNVVVAYTEPNSPAGSGGIIKRGAKLISIDGYDFINGTDNATIDKLNAGLAPKTLGEVHTFEVQNVGSSTTETVVLQSENVTETPVQNVKVLNTPTGNVGYFVFNDHIKTAENGLYDAINQLKAADVTDLVLDVRYNGGGYLYIASELAYMIAGDVTSAKTFEQTIFNDKHAASGLFGESVAPTPFYNGSETLGAFPSLNLSRVYIITSGDTCSASEAIINGLRGVGVEVIQIGSKTCGKPYGFYPQDNCGTTYFTIQFKGVNDKGFGEYSDGFVPSAIDNNKDLVKGCTVTDDLNHELGDTAEVDLATALNYRATGTCTLPDSGTSVRLQKTTMGYIAPVANGRLHKEPGLMNRIMR